MPTLVKELWKCDRCGKVFADDRAAALGCEAAHAAAVASADFGRRMREARLARKLTLIDVARVLDQPPTETVLKLIQAAEEGRHDLLPFARREVAKFLGIEP